MALSSTRLKNALAPEIESQIRSILNLGATPYHDLTKFSEALATAISTKVISEFTTNAQLNNAKFSGTYNVNTTLNNVTITDQIVTGGIS